MALDSLLTRLKRDVSHVSGVQATVYAGLGRYVMKTVDVSDVSDPAPICAGDTSDTAAQNHTYQPEPAWNMACTADTPDTCRRINNEVDFVETAQSATANDPALTTTTEQDLPTVDTTVIDIGTVRPSGLPPLLLAASRALDASIVAAGALPGNDPDRWCYPNGTAMNGSEIDTFAAAIPVYRQGRDPD